MTVKHKPTKEVQPLSTAMCDLMRACMMFPTYGDISWKLSHPQDKEPHRSAHKKKAA